MKTETAIIRGSRVFLLAMLFLLMVLSSGVALAANQISINLQYNAGTSYDPNDDGVEPMNSLVDLTVKNTSFNFTPSPSNLCTRWEVVSLDNLNSTTVCQGSASCCSHLSLISMSGSWDDVFYLNYGAYGATARNTVAARVIYTGTVTNSSGVFLDISYSVWNSLPVTFIDTTPPQVTQKSPQGTIGSSTATLSVTTDKKAVCKYSLTDSEYSIMGSTFTTTDSTRHSQAIKWLSDGNHTFYVRCRDTAGNTMNMSAAVTFTVDTKPPVITSQQPENRIFTDFTILNLTTDKPAVCRYSTSSNVKYEAMASTFGITRGTFHSTELSSLPEGLNTYYVKCRDQLLNTATEDYNASFIVDFAPTAEITLSKSSPLKAGTVDVTVITTKNVRPTPTLTYVLDQDNPLSIPLTGSGSEWHGYMIILDGDKNKVGHFNFSGTSLTGNTGTVITSGNVFLVYTGIPNAISELAAHRADGSGYVSLRWYYPGNEVENFRIYRSTSSGVNNLDYYDNVSKDFYLDTSVAAGESYYYKISAVDNGGNEGPLSKEVGVDPLNVTAAKDTAAAAGQQAGDSSASALSPDLAKRVDNFVASIDRLIGELQAASKKFKDSNFQEIADLGIANAISEKKQEIEALNEQAKQLKSGQLTSTELDNKLQAISDQIDEVKKTVPTDALVEVKKEVKSTAEDYVVQLLTSELLNATKLDSMSEQQKQDFFTRSAELQASVDISTTAKVIKIAYMDGTYDEKTLIEKVVTAKGTDGLRNVLLIESIPKSMAASLKDITFKDSNYGIVQEDPVVMWNYDRLNMVSLKYIINAAIDVGSLGDIKSAVVPNPAAITATKASAITGMVTASGAGPGSAAGIIMGGIIVAGLLGYYVVRVKKGKGGSSSDGKDKAEEKPVDGSSMSHILEEANRSVNRRQLSDAHRLYLQLHSAYDSLEGISMVEKKGIHDSMCRLYNKLLLAMKINEAHSCAARKETANLRFILHNIVDLYSKVDNGSSTEDEQEFMDYARGVYQEYAELLKGTST